MKSDLEIIRSFGKKWKGARIKRAGGQTNRNYVVERGNKKFFVRLPWETDVIDRRVEAENILALSRNKKAGAVLPKYYHYIYRKRDVLNQNQESFDAPDGTMVTEYIPGKLVNHSLLGKEKYQKYLAETFHVFHSSGVRFANRYDVFRDEIAKYRAKAKKHALPSFIGSKTVFEIEQIEKEAKKIVPLRRGVPTHNDFIFQNFLIGPGSKIYLLDFEYAGMNERGGVLYDFAFLFADNFFRTPAISRGLFERFLKVADRVYGRKLERQQIWALAKAVPVMQVWWGLLRYFDSKSAKEKKYFKEYIVRRIKGISRIYQIVK